ncbi:hypothetical protein OG416_38900 [Streptomyces longwoodensis]|uniref:hypothetical protein n=1 Tax=Streptomyces longwoodensis TaxID=68231 RepID=UPI0030E411C5|nr:hypothetical protein OG416_38900 [Streptomyces longwoodensis]
MPDNDDSGKNTEQQLTEEMKAFAEALKDEFVKAYGDRGGRAFAARVGNTDHTSVSRYLRGERLATKWFLDRFEQDAKDQGCPVPPARMQRLRQLRSAALRSSRNSNYRLQAMVEDLEALLEEVRLQRCLDREQIDVQRHARTAALDENRALLERCEQLQQDLAAVCGELTLVRGERDEAETGEREAERGRHQAEQGNAALRRQLEAASVYVRDVHTQLADKERHGERMAQTITSLQHEVSVLRRQLSTYQQPVTAGAAPATAPRGVAAVTESAARSVGAPAAPSSGGEKQTPTQARQDPRELARKQTLWFLTALAGFAAAFTSISWGMDHVGGDHGWPASGVTCVISGLVMLLTFFPFALGRFMRIESAMRPDIASEPSDSSDDYLYSYPPMV